MMMTTRPLPIEFVLVHLCRMQRGEHYRHVMGHSGASAQSDLRFCERCGPVPSRTAGAPERHVSSGPGLERKVAAGGGDEASDAPVGGVLDPAGHGQGGEHDGRCASIDSQVWWNTGRAARSVLDMRKDFSTWRSRL